MTAYYNEFDPFAAAWLRELIADGLIAPGEVDERSIEDVTPGDLRSFQQCHFFAGIGVWSLAARIAGIPDDAPLWSGSCPCQPFSPAGKGGGFADERHLWPAFHYLIEQCEPPLIVGEQVAGADGDAWLDLVSADLDATGYAFGAAETVAAGFGAPHKRSRNYWVAYSEAFWARRNTGKLGEAQGQRIRKVSGQGAGNHVADASGSISSLDHSNTARHEPARGGQQKQSERGECVPSLGCETGIVANSFIKRRSPGRNHHGSDDWYQPDATHSTRPARLERPGPVNGFWRAADWLRCRDETWRPIEPETFPLADAGSVRNRVGLLRGAGNAITIGQAVGWLKAVIASV